MANNRLYIIDTETGDKFMLAKSFGDGWHYRGTNPGEPSIDLRFENWAELRDVYASYGSCQNEKTTLILVSENDPEYKIRALPITPWKSQRSLLWRFAKYLLLWDSRISRMSNKNHSGRV